MKNWQGIPTTRLTKDGEVMVPRDPRGGTLLSKIWGAGSIVWSLGFWLGKDILRFFKNIDLDNS